VCPARRYTIRSRPYDLDGLNRIVHSRWCQGSQVSHGKRRRGVGNPRRTRVLRQRRCIHAGGVAGILHEDWYRKSFGAITAIALRFEPKWLVNKLFRPISTVVCGRMPVRVRVDGPVMPGGRHLGTAALCVVERAGPNHGALFGAYPPTNGGSASTREPTGSSRSRVKSAPSRKAATSRIRPSSGMCLPTSADRKSLRVALWPTTVSLFCTPPPRNSAPRRWPPSRHYPPIAPMLRSGGTKPTASTP